MGLIETVERRGLYFENGRLYQLEIHSGDNKPPYEAKIDVTEDVANAIINTIQGKKNPLKELTDE